MSSCAIMQPTYLPWAGYFNLIASTKHFVFYDDVQLERQSWQSRNRIQQAGKEILLSVPLASQSLSTLIKDVKIANNRPWKKKHFRTIKQVYAKAQYQDVMSDLLMPIYEKDYLYLIDLNTTIIETLSDALRLETEFHFSSDMNVEGERSERLLGICNFLGVTEYLSPVGAQEYLEEDQEFETSEIQLKFQNFSVNQYSQVKTDGFVSHLSIVDVIANHGIEKARNYVTTGKIQ